MKPLFGVNAAEWGALAGLPDGQFRLYLVLRRWMDFATGIVGGPARRLSWQGLREELYVEPVPGVPGTGRSPSREQVRRLAGGLGRQGLVEVRSDRKCLIFHLPLALRDESVQTQADTRPTQGRQVRPTQGRQAEDAAVAGFCEVDVPLGRQVDRGEVVAQADTHPVSGIYTALHDARVREAGGGRLEVGDLVALVGEYFDEWAMLRATTVVGGWAALGLTAVEVLAVFAARWHDEVRSPRFFDGPIRDYVRGRDAECCAGGTGGDRPAGRAGGGAKRGGVGAEIDRLTSEICGFIDADDRRH